MQYEERFGQFWELICHLKNPCAVTETGQLLQNYYFLNGSTCSEQSQVAKYWKWAAQRENFSQTMHCAPTWNVAHCWNFTTSEREGDGRGCWVFLLDRFMGSCTGVFFTGAQEFCQKQSYTLKPVNWMVLVLPVSLLFALAHPGILIKIH